MKPLDQPYFSFTLSSSISSHVSCVTPNMSTAEVGGQNSAERTNVLCVAVPMKYIRNSEHARLRFNGRQHFITNRTARSDFMFGECQSVLITPWNFVPVGSLDPTLSLQPIPKGGRMGLREILYRRMSVYCCHETFSAGSLSHLSPHTVRSVSKVPKGGHPCLVPGALDDDYRKTALRWWAPFVRSSRDYLAHEVCASFCGLMSHSCSFKQAKLITVSPRNTKLRLHASQASLFSNFPFPSPLFVLLSCSTSFTSVYF